MSEHASDTERMIQFIESIGIPVRYGPVPDDSFLPGILIDRGALVVDRQKMLYPGDLLHEAGHIAVMHPKDRPHRVNDISKNAGDEIGTICWSWAAAMHVGISGSMLFHPNGYKGSAESLRTHFEAGTYVGLPLLEWYGLTAGPKRAAEIGIAPFPHMVKWLREETP